MSDSTRPTFAAWLRAQRHRDEPIGDVARDTARDRGHRVTTPAALVRRIERVSGYPPALDAARQAEREWEASR